MKALEGLRVVEIAGGYASGYCTHLLAQFGAEVTKVEPPGGDALRQMGPWPADHRGDPEWSLPHLWLDAGKASVTCDPAVAGDLQRLQELMAGADAVVANEPAGELAGYGLDAETFCDTYPQAVLVTLSPFGSFGSCSGWRASHLNAAASGAGCFFGAPEREPLAVPALQGPVQAGTHAAGALLAVLHDGRENGGDWIDISEADLWGAHVGGFRVHSVVRDGIQRTRFARRNPTLYPYGLYQCRDGYITEVALRGAEWKRFLQVLGDGAVPEWAGDPRFANRRANARLHVEELDARQQPWLASRSRDDIFEVARAQRLAFAPIYDVREVLANAHLRAREFFGTVTLPDGRSAEVPGVPYRMSRTPGAPSLPAAPRQGSATFRAPSPSPRPASRTSAPAGAPLAGLRVLDLGNVIAGPACSRMLGDFGAEVIKVESTHHVDAMRSSEANRSAGDLERDPAYHFVNRGKKGVALDFTIPEGRAMLLRLAARCDVVVENFAPRVLPKNKLDYAAFAALNSRIIMLSMPGAGDRGPQRDIVGYGNVTAGLSGIGSLSGYSPTELVFPPALYGDWISAAHGFAAVMTALRHRDRTGEGQSINLSQWETACAAMGREFLTYTAAGVVPAAWGNRDALLAPHNLFPTADSGWVAIVCSTDAEWQRLLDALGRPAWACAPMFDTSAGRVENVEELERGLGAWTQARSADEVSAILQDAGVAASPLLDVDALVSHPHYAQRQAFAEVEDELLGKVLMGGTPWKARRRQLTPPRRGPRMGEHNDEIYRGLLGMSSDEIDALARLGVIE